MGKLPKKFIRALSKLRGRVRVQRPKTFTNEVAANAWAKEQGLTNYKLDNMKSTESQTKKIRIVVEV